MDIYKMLKDGMSVEEVTKLFTSAIKNAQAQVEKENKEAEEQAIRAEYVKARKQEAKEALGAALINFALAYDIIDEANEEMVQWVDTTMESLARAVFTTTTLPKSTVWKWRFI